MACFHLFSLLIFCKIVEVCSRGPVYTPPDVERLTDRFDRVSVDKSYNVAFGGPNIHVTDNGTSADLSLDKSSGNLTYILKFFSTYNVSIFFHFGFICFFLVFLGSGLVSKNKYNFGFFNAALKLPSGFTSGVVVAYYVRIRFCRCYRFPGHFAP